MVLEEYPAFHADRWDQRKLQKHLASPPTLDENILFSKLNRPGLVGSVDFIYYKNLVYRKAS